MITITIPLDPVPWTAARLSRGRCYDPKEKDKRAARWHVKDQYRGDLLQGYFSIFFDFVFEPPKSASKKRREAMLCGLIIPTKGDCTNYQKLYEDCLKKIVIEDDRNVEVIGSRKLYGEKGMVIIKILTRNEYKELLAYYPCKL
jgi:Holliday junction resolvase RusA-like endonuclease